MIEASIHAITRLLGYVRSAPYPDLTPAFTLSCAASPIHEERDTALASLEILLEEEIRKRNPNRLAELVKRGMLNTNAVNPTASKIHPVTLDDAVGLGLLTVEEQTLLLSISTSQPTVQFCKDDDTSQILQQLELETETRRRVCGRCTGRSESRKREPEPPPERREKLALDIDQVQVKTALERRFKGTFERPIDGTYGRIFIFKYPSNTIPERIAVKTIDPAKIMGPSNIGDVNRLAHEVKHWITYRHSPFVVAPFFTEIVCRVAVHCHALF